MRPASSIYRARSPYSPPTLNVPSRLFDSASITHALICRTILLACRCLGAADASSRRLSDQAQQLDYPPLPSASPSLPLQQPSSPSSRPRRPLTYPRRVLTRPKNVRQGKQPCPLRRVSHWPRTVVGRQLPTPSTQAASPSQLFSDETYETSRQGAEAHVTSMDSAGVS